MGEKEELFKEFEERLKEMEENEFVFSESGNVIKEIKKIDLIELHNVYRDLLYIEDTKRIDIVLATALSRKLDGIPIWLLLVGPSGDMKSVQLNALKDENAFILHNMTSKTLVNGYKNKAKYPDLAPELDDKLVIIPDMAQILKLAPVEKAELWGQLRDLYDGMAGKVSGQGSMARYDNLKVTLIAGSTPSIDAQILIHQDLGTRELIYRTEGNKNKEKVMKKCFENEELEEMIKNRLKEVTTTFIRQTKIKRNPIKPEITEKIMEIATYITYMRAIAEIDSYTNSLRNDVYPEEPTRIAKQLKRIYICLMSLANDYPEERALEILQHIAKSSAFPLRIKIFEHLLNLDEEKSTSNIAETLCIGKSTAQRELAVMWNMGIVRCRKKETSYPDKFYDFWKVNENHQFIKNIKKKLFGLKNEKH